MPIPTFNYEAQKNKVTQTLQAALPANATVATEEGWHGRVHVKIVSEVFNGMSERQKQDHVWDILHNLLGAESQSVSLVLAYGTDEL